MRQQALTPPSPGGTTPDCTPGAGPRQSLNRRLGAPLLSVLLSVLFSLAWPAAASAAEVLQVRDSHLLQVGDRNRNYTVELVCYTVDPQREEAATAWLRQQLPRRTRINLRPLGDHEGRLQARVNRLETRPDTPADLGEGLIAAGLARASDCSRTTVPSPTAAGTPLS